MQLIHVHIMVWRSVPHEPPTVRCILLDGGLVLLVMLSDAVMAGKTEMERRFDETVEWCGSAPKFVGGPFNGNDNANFRHAVLNQRLLTNRGYGFHCVRSIKYLGHSRSTQASHFANIEVEGAHLFDLERVTMRYEIAYPR